MAKEKKLELDLTPQHKINIPLIIALMTTAIGAFGNFPASPKVVDEFFNQNPQYKWILIFLLLFQGQGGENIFESALGTGITYLIWRYLNSLDPQEEK